MKNKSKGTALVTGAAKRLGQAVALHLADQGYSIALHYNSSKAEAMKTAAFIYKKGVRCELFACDLADPKEALRLMAQVHQAFPDLNLLINSASIFVPNTFGAQDLTLFNAHWNINFKAPYILSCEFVRLVKQGGIINFIDTNVVKNSSRYSDYLLSKKALAEFTKMAAVSFGEAIRVNGISPGMILTPVNSQKDDREIRAKKIPLKSVGNPQYILDTIDFLLKNTYVTGQIIAVDGGEQLV
ncbi:MAG: SDR family oxidoreductase [Candidatus Omnitrophica bacterium]|nr:SDR family oxidoreductase [Candidatus Omnitrophota bacterium]